jgi:hypothetical protein
MIHIAIHLFWITIFNVIYVINGFENLPAYKKCGFDPKVIMDVGANVGDFAKGFHEDFPNAKIFMVEGNEECVDMLQRTGFDFEIALVGETVRNVTYFRSNNKYGMYFSYAIYFIISMYIYCYSLHVICHSFLF